MKRLNVVPILSLSIFISMAACEKKTSEVIVPDQRATYNPESEPKLDETAPENDPTAVPPEFTADGKDHPFKSRIIGVWTECLDTSASSSYDGIERLRSTRHTLTFDDKDNLEFVTEDFFGKECQGEVKARDIVEMHYALGSDHGNGVFDFDMIVRNELNNEALETTFSSIKLVDPALFISLGASSSPSFGNGVSPDTRYTFPIDPEKAVNYVLRKGFN